MIYAICAIPAALTIITMLGLALAGLVVVLGGLGIVIFFGGGLALDAWKRRGEKRCEP